MECRDPISSSRVEHTHALTGRRLLLVVFIGTAFVLNSFIAGFVYGSNPRVADLSAAVGAGILFLPILWTAIQDLRHGHVHMNELVALAVLGAFSQGDFKTGGVISFLMLISLLIEARSEEGAHASIESLIRMTPTTARRLREDGSEEEISAHELRVGDRIRILPGDHVAADGTIDSGTTTLDESTITGESLPRDKSREEEVFAGTHNLTGSIEVTVTREGEDTTLGRVRELIVEANKTKHHFMRIIDRYAGYYTPTILMIAGIVWFFTNDMNRVVALLVVSCPCALILATPTATVAALSAAARLGILVKQVADLEVTAGVTALVFDKTGTLTTGRLGVSRLAPREGVKPSDLLYVAASAERFSNHPVALALADLAAQAGLQTAQPEDVHEESGQGVRARVDGQTMLLGRANWLKSSGVADETLEAADLGETEGFSVIFVARDGRYLGWIGLQDQVREEAAPSLQELRELNVKRIAMVTGDRESVAQRVAEQIGCSEYRAECLPQQKVEFVNQIKQEGYRVTVVGDGVNDAPALAAGDTGIAMGAVGSDVAVHSATIALMNNDLRRIPFLLRLSRSAKAIIYQNLAIGVLFIFGGLVLSALGYLHPIIAAVMHNAGSIVVILNSGRLVRLGEEFEPHAQMTESKEAPPQKLAALLAPTS